MVSRIEDNFLGSYTIKLDSAYPIDRHIMELGTWELHVVHLIHRFVKPGDVCVAVGANAGYHTLPMAGSVGPKGCVYAFEPNDITYTKLIENLELNPTLKERVSVVKMGLASEEGEMKIFQSGAEPGNAYISNTFKEELWNMGTADDFIRCRVVRLDSYLKDSNRVGLIKVDVEGMEYSVLKGADGILKRDQPTIIYETLLDNFSHELILKTDAYLRSLEYEVLGIDPNTEKLVPVAYPNFGADTVAIHKLKLANAPI